MQVINMDTVNSQYCRQNYWKLKTKQNKERTKKKHKEKKNSYARTSHKGLYPGRREKCCSNILALLVIAKNKCFFEK